MIRFMCECGKQLQAREENAGKLVLCPACQRQIRVPAAPPPPEALQPAEPAARPSAEPRVQRERPALEEEPAERWEEEEESRERRPPRRPAAGNSGKAIASLILGIVSLCGCTCLAGLPSILLGILSLRDIGRSAGALTGKPMAIIGLILGSLGTLCWPPAYFFGIQTGKERAREVEDKENAKRNLVVISNAVRIYQDKYKKFPPAGLGDPSRPQEGQQPLLSWRVAILPHLIGEGNLYKQFKLDEAWDGPNNIKLLAKMPKVYQLPGDTTTPPDHTVFQVFTGSNTMFEAGRDIRRPDFPDGMNNTLMIVEAAKGVPWTKPEDIPFDAAQPVAPLLGGHYRGIFLAVAAEGSPRELPQTIPETVLKAAITRNGGENFTWP